ncbi:MAG TPA: hypothetical protein VJS20_04525 [Gemmatimonadales bacterium]|nr:hypothetical protein [Gemmatimonadales bacterium]
MRLARLLPLLAAGVLLLACQDDPVDSFTGAYGMSAVDGHALPGLVGATVNCDLILSSGLLDVSAESFGITMLVVQDCRRTGGDTSLVFLANAGGIHVSHDTLFLADTVGTDSVSYMTATRQGNTLSLNLPADGSYILTPHTVALTTQPFINRH